MTSCSGLSSVSCDKQRAFYYTVHGFLQAEYDVDEEERLDTMFRLNVKGTTPFGALIVMGVVTTTADGTASKSEEYEQYYSWGAKLHLPVKLHWRL